MNRNPFPGPQPYRASDRHRFYGREELSYRLEGSVLANRCVTVYGPSGAGKSSLVQASVIPSLVESRDIRVARVDGWPEDREPTRWLADALFSNLGLGEPPADLSAADALLAAGQRAARRSPRIVLVYLDQMEQLLYSGRTVAESEAFFDCLSRLVELPLRNLNMVLSLREDYLGRFRERLHDHHRILDHGFRVGPLTVAELCGAVCQTAAAGEPPQTWEPARMRALMLQVRVPGQPAEDDAEAQAAYAQIVCRALFQQRAQGGAPADEGEAEPILHQYLEATLADLGPLRESAQRLLEEHLVTADGSRTLRTEKELLRLLPIEQLSPVLEALEGAAILHAEEHQGSRYFEIGHDWLARKVFEKRQHREREEEQQRELRRQRDEADARLAKERRERRGLAVIALVSIVVAVGAAGLGFWAWQHKRAAEAAKNEADGHRQTAERQRVAAHDAQIVASFRELVTRGQLAWAMKLLPEVERPRDRYFWVALANDALRKNALLVSLRGHKGALSAARWSPDGKRVLTGSSDTTARVWSADGEGMPIVLEGHHEAIVAAAWSPDGKRVLTGSSDATARVWSADGEGRPVVLEGHRDALVAASFSPDGERVLTASRDGTARIFHADGSGPAIVLKGHRGPLTAAVWSPDGKRVFTASEDGTARIWEAAAAGESVILRGHTAAVLSLAASPDGTRVVTTSRDRTARVWSVDGKGPPVVLRGHEGVVYHAAVSPDGKHVATASADCTARVWSVDGKGEPVVLSGHALSVVSVAWSPDGSYVSTASADKTARLWPADGGGPPLVLSGHQAPLRSAEWSPDGSRVLTAADRSGHTVPRTARVWSTERLRSLPRTPRGAGVFHSAFFGEGGERVISAYDDNTARLFRLGGEGDPVVFKGHEAWVASAALSPDGSHVVTASFDRTARVFRVDGVGSPVVLRGHEAEVRFAAFAPDGARVVTVSDDRTARIFRADGKGSPVVLAGHDDWLTAAAWSPDGTRVVTTSLDRTARVFRADGSGAPLVLSGHEGDVYAAAWSPDGKRIITASEDRTARIWNADGSGAPTVLRGHLGPVLCAVWSPDGHHVATSSADSTVRVWSADGEGKPIVLEAPAVVIAMAFLDAGEMILAVASDNSTHKWIIDIDELKRRLSTAHGDCVPPDVRSLSLGESARAARERYEACERSHGRTPPPDELIAR